ncbi:hypothetical protein CVV38_00400 [Candidatus Peregrinibacteria bacterium HGW-Peregrinibacteria-1]|jgi:manganese/zinc/iron transport system ATP- binding protein|nr:MAG: hypothetical protein CVV38_00400 [Candidatus Peregrinibacteria bacterium HGW-Peregrinibacteria-1]
MKKNENVVEVRDLTVVYDRVPVVWNVDIEITKGHLVGIIGPNGAGKTTLLKALLGLTESVSGEVSFFGDSYGNVRKRVAYVPQRDSVDWDFPTTVYDVVMMGRYTEMRFWQRPGDEDHNVVKRALKNVGIEDLAERRISELSGGQKQRVFLARAMAQQAELYLLDEPYAGIDVATEKTISDILKDLVSKGKTVVVVHHDLSTVKEYFDSVIMLNVRKVASGSVEEVFVRGNLEKLYGGSLPFMDNLKI